MSDETPPHGIERSISKHPASRGKVIPSVHSRNQPDMGPNPHFRFKDSSNAPREPEADTDPTAAGGIERTTNTGLKKEGRPNLKVIKGGKED